jgi:hypothetical protein
MFVDACGWGVVEPRPWFLPALTHRQKATSLFGFSSACVPAILSGRRPDENDHWSSFFLSPSTSPFKALRALRVLPKSLFDRGRVRRYLSKAIAKVYGITGYFQIYNLPFEALPLFDYAERKDIFQPGGINRGTSIFDEVKARGIPYHVSNWRASEGANLASLEAAVTEGRIRWAFLYTADLDAILHDRTKTGSEVDVKMRWYGEKVAALLEKAKAHYDEVRLMVVSDHGMATVTKVVDLMPRLEALGFAYGTDYAAVYDSTMLRFWFLRPGAEEAIRAALPPGDGRWVTPDEMKAYGTWWPDGKFGHAVYALEPGVLLNPSHMGRVAPSGMHGYRPEHPDADAVLLANFVPESPVVSITDFRRTMLEMATWATAP